MKTFNDKKQAVDSNLNSRGLSSYSPPMQFVLRKLGLIGVCAIAISGCGSSQGKREIENTSGIETPVAAAQITSLPNIDENPEFTKEQIITTRTDLKLLETLLTDADRQLNYLSTSLNNTDDAISWCKTHEPELSLVAQSLAAVGNGSSCNLNGLQSEEYKDSLRELSINAINGSSAVNNLYSICSREFDEDDTTGIESAEKDFNRAGDAIAKAQGIITVFRDAARADLAAIEPTIEIGTYSELLTQSNGFKKILTDFISTNTKDQNLLSTLKDKTYITNFTNKLDVYSQSLDGASKNLYIKENRPEISNYIEATSKTSKDISTLLKDNLNNGSSADDANSVDAKRKLNASVNNLSNQIDDLIAITHQLVVEMSPLGRETDLQNSASSNVVANSGIYWDPFIVDYSTSYYPACYYTRYSYRDTTANTPYKSFQKTLSNGQAITIKVRQPTGSFLATKSSGTASIGRSNPFTTNNPKLNSSNSAQGVTTLPKVNSFSSRVFGGASGFQKNSNNAFAGRVKSNFVGNRLGGNFTKIGGSLTGGGTGFRNSGAFSKGPFKTSSFSSSTRSSPSISTSPTRSSSSSFGSSRGGSYSSPSSSSS